MPFIILLSLLKAQHVSGTTMPIIRSIVVPEKCQAYKKHNKIISGIWLFLYSSDNNLPLRGETGEYI